MNLISDSASQKNKEVLGIDFGNVIIDHLNFGTTKEFIDYGDYNMIPPVPGAIETLSALRKRFNDNIFVIYNATQVVDDKIYQWLEYNNFVAKTGIPLEHVMRTTQGRNKLDLCLKYGINNFIDDRLEVLSHLVGAVQNLYLFRPQHNEIEEYKHSIDHVRVLHSWSEIEKALI